MTGGKARLKKPASDKKKKCPKLFQMKHELIKAEGAREQASGHRGSGVFRAL